MLTIERGWGREREREREREGEREREREREGERERCVLPVSHYNSALPQHTFSWLLH